MSNDDRIMFSFQTDLPWYLDDVLARDTSSEIEKAQNSGLGTGALSPFNPNSGREFVWSIDSYFKNSGSYSAHPGVAAATECSLKP